MVWLSVDLVLADWPLNRILASQLTTYSRCATRPVGDLERPRFRGAGYDPCLWRRAIQEPWDVN